MEDKLTLISEKRLKELLEKEKELYKQKDLAELWKSRYLAENEKLLKSIKEE
jgi:hypothetical protein